MACVRRLTMLIGLLGLVLGLTLSACSTAPTTPTPATPASMAVRTTAASPAPAATAATTTRDAPSSSRPTPRSGLPTIAERRLPAEAQETLRLIRAGGPYPYRQDDRVFQNRERLLPRQPRGYYREYTVETPGEDDRGPRRLVRGTGGDLYWTVDHYASFRQVQEGR